MSDTKTKRRQEVAEDHELLGFWNNINSDEDFSGFFARVDTTSFLPEAYEIEGVGQDKNGRFTYVAHVDYDETAIHVKMKYDMGGKLGGTSNLYSGRKKGDSYVGNWQRGLMKGVSLHGDWAIAPIDVVREILKNNEEFEGIETDLLKVSFKALEEKVADIRFDSNPKPLVSLHTDGE